MPRTHGGDEQPRCRLDVDEVHPRDAEPLGEVAGDVDLEATRQDDVAVAHHTRLEDRIAETERDDELGRARLRGDGGGGGGSSARLSAGRPRATSSPAATMAQETMPATIPIPPANARTAERDVTGTPRRRR